MASKCYIEVVRDREGNFFLKVVVVICFFLKSKIQFVLLGKTE